MLLTAFVRALAQLPEPDLRRPALASLALALAIFVLLWSGLGLAIAHTRVFEIAWLGTAVAALGGVGAVVLTWLLYPTAVAAVLPLVVERVSRAVETRHYPGLPPPRAVPVREQVVDGARFLLVAVALNLAALPLYLVPALNLVAFYGLNGYLLGREYYEMVAPRRLVPADQHRLRRDRRGWLFGAGLVIAFASTVPLVNLVAPVAAAAAMTHLVEAWRRGLPRDPAPGAARP